VKANYLVNLKFLLK